MIIGLFFSYIYNEIFHTDSGKGILASIMFIGMLTIFFTYFYQYYDFEKIKNLKKGFLEGDTNWWKFSQALQIAEIECTSYAWGIGKRNIKYL